MAEVIGYISPFKNKDLARAIRKAKREQQQRNTNKRFKDVKMSDKEAREYMRQNNHDGSIATLSDMTGE